MTGDSRALTPQRGRTLKGIIGIVYAADISPVTTGVVTPRLVILLDHTPQQTAFP